MHEKKIVTATTNAPPTPSATSPATSRYAVIGHPVAHSKSPQIHALFARQTRQQMRYEAILAPLDGFADSLREFAAGGGRGANVTVPFKEQAFRLSPRLTPRATAAGAVNTLTFEGGVITGDNTDGAGLVRDLQVNLDFSIAGKRVLLLGAGGAARGVILPLLHESPAAMTIVNRTLDKAQHLAEEFSDDRLLLSPSTSLRAGLSKGSGSQGSTSSPRTVTASPFHHLSQSFDLIINATSAGVVDAPLPLPESVFAAGCLAYEMFYGRETHFMRQAKAMNAQVADGLGMLVEQAAESFQVWRGVRPDTASVLKTLRHAQAPA